MIARGSPIRRTLISSLPALSLVIGGVGMAWASSHTAGPRAEADPPAKSDPVTSTVVEHKLNSGKKSLRYWTPKRMRNAKPAQMPVEPIAPVP